MDASQRRVNPSDARLLRGLQIHRFALLAILVAINAANLFTGAPWWAFWPSAVWAVIFTVHLCVVRSIVIDEEWVNARANDLREHSYDFDHMKDLEKRIVDSDFSVVPRAERDDRKREE